MHTHTQIVCICYLLHTTGLYTCGMQHYCSVFTIPYVTVCHQGVSHTCCCIPQDLVYVVCNTIVLLSLLYFVLVPDVTIRWATCRCYLLHTTGLYTCGMQHYCYAYVTRLWWLTFFGWGRLTKTGLFCPTYFYRTNPSTYLCTPYCIWASYRPSTLLIHIL